MKFIKKTTFEWRCRFDTDFHQKRFVFVNVVNSEKKGKNLNSGKLRYHHRKRK